MGVMVYTCLVGFAVVLCFCSFLLTLVSLSVDGFCGWQGRMRPFFVQQNGQVHEVLLEQGHVYRKRLHL